MSAEAGSLAPHHRDRLEAAARAFSALALAAPGAKPEPVPDFLALAAQAGTLGRPARWWNIVVRSPSVRHLHVEHFEIADAIAVVHVCGVREPDASSPIFGFDIIAGAQRATGAFLDLSAVDARSAEVSDRWGAWRAAAFTGALGAERALPDWGDIFSRNVVAMRPESSAHVEQALAQGLASLRWWLDLPPTPAEDPDAVRAAQQRYGEAQRSNEHTARMLAQVVGRPLADRFIAEHLFPEPLSRRSAAAGTASRV